MTEILLALAAMALSCIAMLVAFAFWRVLLAGPGRVAHLRRKDYGFTAWATGQLSKTSDGSTLHELEGLELQATRGRLSYVRQTRAPTAEL